MVASTKLEVFGPEAVAPCPVVRFNALTGGRYKLRILWELRRGPRRYSEVQRALIDATGGRSITPRTLSSDLRELVLAALISQSVSDRPAARRIPPHPRRPRDARSPPRHLPLGRTLVLAAK
jgi:DNA-binding HxlR family transcriptional regulator